MNLYQELIKWHSDDGKKVRYPPFESFRISLNLHNQNNLIDYIFEPGVFARITIWPTNRLIRFSIGDNHLVISDEGVRHYHFSIFKSVDDFKVEFIKIMKEFIK